MFGIFFKDKDKDKDKDTPMIAPASTLVLLNKNIVNFTHNHRHSQYSKIFEFFDRTFS